MLSGRYLTDRQQRHWSDNRSGFCLLPACLPSRASGSLEYLFISCPALSSKRERLIELAKLISSESPILSELIPSILNNPDQHQLVQLLLDCSTMPVIIRIAQQTGPYVRDRLLYLGRTWCYSLHRDRMKQLQLEKFI